MASVLAPSPRILRDLLAAKGSWSQSDVASRSGLSRAMVSTLFNGRRQWVSWSTRQAVADAFSVLTAELYDDYAPDKGGRLDHKNLDLYHSLACALKAEFAGSSLRGNLAAKNQKKILSRLDGDNVPDAFRKHFTASEGMLRAGPLTGLARPGAVLRKTLKGRPLSVATNAMECGTVAALLRAKDHLREEGVDLQIDFSRIHGGDLVRALNTGKESYDFGVLGFSPMYLDLTIYVGRSDYFLLTPVHVASQCVYASSADKGRLKLAYYLEGGSGELQAIWAGGGRDQLGQRPPQFEVLRDRRTFSVAKDMDAKTGVIAYSALGATLEEELGLKRVDNTSFDIHACLFAHQERVGQNTTLAKAFTAVFCRAYDDCASKPKIASRLLWNNLLYLRRYASGAKITFNEG